MWIYLAGAVTGLLTQGKKGLRTHVWNMMDLYISYTHISMHQMNLNTGNNIDPMSAATDNIQPAACRLCCTDQNILSTGILSIIDDDDMLQKLTFRFMARFYS